MESVQTVVTCVRNIRMTGFRRHAGLRIAQVPRLISFTFLRLNNHVGRGRLSYKVRKALQATVYLVLIQRLFLVANSCFKPQILMVCRLVHSHTFTSLRFVLHSARFPNTNQTRHCFQNYTDYFKCITAKGEDFAPCKQFKRAYNSLCPSMCINVSLVCLCY